MTAFGSVKYALWKVKAMEDLKAVLGEEEGRKEFYEHIYQEASSKFLGNLPKKVVIETLKEKFPEAFV